MLPGLPTVVRSRQTRAALQRSTNHINSLAGRMHGDRDAYASVVLRQRCDFGPRLTFIDRFVECGAVWSLWRTASNCVLRRCEDHVRHVESVFDVARAVSVFRSQRVLPCLAAVSRSIDASSVMVSI